MVKSPRFLFQIYFKMVDVHDIEDAEIQSLVSRKSCDKQKYEKNEHVIFIFKENEFQWLLQNEVSQVLKSLEIALAKCISKFPMTMGHGSQERKGIVKFS